MVLMRGQTVEYMTYQLIQGYQRGDAIPRSTLNRYDFYVLPIVNPDGKYDRAEHSSVPLTGLQASFTPARIIAYGGRIDSPAPARPA